MAKKSKIMHNIHRKNLVNRYSAKRKELVAMVKDLSLSYEERQLYRLKLEKLPKNSSRIRVRNRCNVTGRPRGVYRKFGLGRNKLRELAMKGDIPGLVKSSW
jgi:small subunit ribosomal protein S14